MSDKTELRSIRILRMPELQMCVPLSRSAIYDRLNPKSPRFDATFPKQIKLGGDAVGWLADEVEVWILARMEESRSQQ